MKKDEWVIGVAGMSFKTGQKIEAVIRHCNPKLKLPDETVILTSTDDGFYIDDGPDELSYNWDIVKWRKVSKPKKTKK